MAVLDDFTNTDGTNLTAHTPSGGGSWAKHASYTGNLVIDTNRARLGSNASEARYYHSHTPSSADYTVKAAFHFLTTLGSQFPALAARLNTSADTCYLAQYDSGGLRWRLFKRVAGVATQLGTNFSDTPSNGTTRVVELIVTGTSIEVKIDGTSRCGTPLTDSEISAAGQVGLIDFASTAPSNTTGIHFDNMEIVESGGGGSNIAALMNYYRQMEAENAAG